MIELGREGPVFVLEMNSGENRFNGDFVGAFHAARLEQNFTYPTVRIYRATSLDDSLITSYRSSVPTSASAGGTESITGGGGNAVAGSW